MAKKILVVDDEPHFVRLAQINLERAGYEVVTAIDGKDALKKVEVAKPDLVVLDMEMPHMDGFEVLQNLRKNPATRELPVILMTSPHGDVMRDWQSDIDDYIMKPYNPDQLNSIVKRLLAAQDGDEANREEVNTAIPTPPPDRLAQPVTWWRTIEEVWRKIGF